MATITAGDFRNGKTFEMDGKIMQVVEFQHVKPGKGAAFVRTKMKNVVTGAVTETSFNPTAKFEEAFIERRIMSTATTTAICTTSWIRRRTTWSPSARTCSTIPSSSSRKTPRSSS